MAEIIAGYVFDLVTTAVQNFVLGEIYGIIYVFRIGRNFNKVKREKNKLVVNRELMQEKVEAVDLKTEKVNDSVIEWLKESKILIQEAENPKIKARPRSWREFREIRTEQAALYFSELLRRIATLNMGSDFDNFSTPIPNLEQFSFGNIMGFKSTNEASDELLEALQDDNYSIIGLYGRHGSGKTTLAKAIGEKVKFLNIFYVVLFATVTQNPNITTMQDEIADSLNMKFDRNSQAGRARRIFSTIESMERPILVIFDDVREKFDPEDVGIPCNSKQCKVLLTTRRQQDCNLMYCQREIHLGPLSTEEAWTLFQKHSSIGDEEYSSSYDLLNVAREVAFECDGLPGIIKDVGSSLRSKPIDEWKASLDIMRHSMARWHVFLSFRGEDTRYSFTGFLYQALCQGGLKTFMDDGGLHTGDQISPSLTNAIEASRLSIIVLSENYASSPWCLDELVKILECVKLKNQLVWPIFYKVEPSDIRYLRKCYGKDMAYHENKFGIFSDRIQKWRSALFEVSNLSGKTYTTGYEYEFIQKIVEDANRIKSRLQIRRENNPFSSIHSQTIGDVLEMGLGSGSTSTFSAAIGSAVNDSSIQERVSKLEKHLESERQKRRLMELDLHVERAKRRLIELKLEAEQERRQIMEETLLSFFHKMLGRVPQQFSYLLSQTQSAKNEESEDQDFFDVSIQSL